MLHSHNCGELRKKDIKKNVILCGWVQSRRDHGGVIFVDLRDRYGLTQVVFDPSHNKETHKTAENVGREWVLRIEGKVRLRKKGMRNPKLSTGDIEIITDKVFILNKSLMPPIEVEEEINAGEEVRLKHRYVDLRRPSLKNNILFRHKVMRAAREALNEENFVEIETPMLIRHTPEGARDFIVPSRLHPGRFYSLPQSPQLYKQLLMVSGFDRYYQFARCLRDEDLRADRQPEFTQIDLEMSFVEEDDVFDVVEKMLKIVFRKVLGKNLKTPFPRLSYDEAMSCFGSDSPDTRFGLELVDVTDIVKEGNFEVFNSSIKKGGIVFCLNAKKCASFSRKEVEELTSIGRTYHLAGLAWIKMEKKPESSIVKFFPEKVLAKLVKKVDAKKGDLLLFAAEKFERATTALGHVRTFLGKKLGLIPDIFSFVWINKFPLFKWDEEQDSWSTMHHLFTMPFEEHIKFLDRDPEKVYGHLYDLTLNGTELGSGSIRIHDKALQEKIFEVVGFSKKRAEQSFGFFLNSLEYGAPPHGGIALGFDRLVALLLGLDDIREVIAFPKNKKMEGVMEDSPNEVDPNHLREQHIKLEVLKSGNKR